MDARRKREGNGVGNRDGEQKCLEGVLVMKGNIVMLGWGGAYLGDLVEISHKQAGFSRQVS
jgi:hypothetical protein